MKIVNEGASIECLGAEIISRKFTRNSLILIPKVGKCMKYKCSLNSEAIILKELDPKEPKYNEASFLSINDMIEAENIVVYVNQIKNLKFTLINHSGRHKAQQSNTNTFTFAQITKQFPNLPKINTIKEISPII